jgi:hypothetical protein
MTNGAQNLQPSDRLVSSSGLSQKGKRDVVGRRKTDDGDGQSAVHIVLKSCCQLESSISSSPGLRLKGQPCRG